MTTALTLFDTFDGNIGKKKVDFTADTFKAVLSNTLPAQTTAAVLADITEIANGNGYTSGGVTLASVTFTQAVSVWTFTSASFSWTSSGAGMATFRYGAIYDSTANVLIGWWDHGVAVTLPVAAVYTVTPNASGLLTTSRSP